MKVNLSISAQSDDHMYHCGCPKLTEQQCGIAYRSF